MRRPLTTRQHPRVMRATAARRCIHLRPTPAQAIDLFDLSPTNLKVTFPNPRQTLADMLEADILDGDIDPRKYYPPDVYREPAD